MTSIRICAVLLATGLSVLPGCGGREAPLLDVHELMGSSPEQLRVRLGPPDGELEETPARFGFLRWNRLQGVRVLVMVRKDSAVYITYTFRDMEDFDEAEALALAGIERPRGDPTLIEKSEAVRWEEYEKFGRLTINPGTRMVSIGNPPVSGGTRPADAEVAAGEH